jgi:L-asparaginase/Glu-tRNA(Gln) amidotransferase subunit D
MAGQRVTRQLMSKVSLRGTDTIEETAFLFNSLRSTSPVVPHVRCAVGICFSPDGPQNLRDAGCSGAKQTCFRVSLWCRASSIGKNVQRLRFICLT